MVDRTPEEIAEGRRIERLFVDLGRCIDGALLDVSEGAPTEDIAHARSEVRQACAELGRALADALAKRGAR